jgi:NitT/TauT family transport system ATP-binding protein
MAITELSPPSTTTSDTIVNVEGIGKVYPGGTVALKGVDLDIPKGEMTTLLGPSGCGKTTLLKIIAGLLDSTEGQIKINGKVVTGPGPERAFVFQDFALLPWATVLDNVAFGLEMQGMGKAEREAVAHRNIEKVGLTGFHANYPHELSGGMRQRVGLARALSVSADVLLMDEPFSAVDEQTRRLFQEELLRLLATENKTVIFVTHSIEEAVYVSDQIVLLSPRPGRINRIVRAEFDRHGKTADEIRREEGFLDTVEDIWSTLKEYLIDERMVE